MVYFTDNDTTPTKLFCFVLCCWLGCGNYSEEQWIFFKAIPGQCKLRLNFAAHFHCCKHSLAKRIFSCKLFYLQVPKTISDSVWKFFPPTASVSQPASCPDWTAPCSTPHCSSAPALAPGWSASTWLGCLSCSSWPSVAPAQC